MKILYISTSLLRNESASIRNIGLLNGLVQNKVEVDVITLNYLEKLEDEFLKNNLNSKIKIKKIQLNRFNKIFSKISKKKFVKKNLKMKIVEFFKEKVKQYIFFPDVYCEAIKNVDLMQINIKNYDYVVSSSDSKTSHFIAERVLKLNKIKKPWIQIWGDPWESDIGLKKNSFFIKYKIKKYEKKLLEKADKIIYVSNLTASEMKNKYPKLSHKIFCLLRSYFKEIKTEKKDRGKYIFSYTGSTKNRNLNPLINTIKEYNKKNQKKIQIKFYGIEEENNIFNDENICIYPRLSLKEILKSYEESDVLVYIDNLGNTTQVPGKIYDYFGTDKIILGLYENNKNKEELEKYNRIELFKNKERDIILEKILTKIGEQKILEEFSPKNKANEFIKIIEG